MVERQGHGRHRPLLHRCPAHRRRRTGNLYRVGVYGSGQVCSAILDRGLADYCWLANARAWPGYNAHLASGRWQMRQLMPGKCGDREVDFNFLPSRSAYFGQFR